MRRTTAARLGAAFAASAIALSLGAGTALAEGDTSGTQTVHAASISPTAGTAAKVPAGATRDGKSLLTGSVGRSSVTPLALPPTSKMLAYNQKSVVLTEPGLFIFEGSPVVTNPAGIGFIDTRVTVGTKINARELGFPGGDFGPPIPEYPAHGVVLPSTTPVGKAHLGPANIWYQNPDHTLTMTSTHDTLIGGTFYIRRGTKSIATNALTVTRSGSKVTFKATSWKIFQPSTGKYVGIRSIKLQYRNSNGSYSTLKTMPLNIYGTGSYSITTSTKRSYRLLIPTTDSISASLTTTVGPI